MRVGGPSHYKPEYCERLIEFMSQGYSFQAFAGHIGCSRSVIYKWVDAHPEFAEAKDAGFEASRVCWERIGIEIAKKNKGNAVAFIFNMKNRFKEEWRDKQEIENSGHLNITWNEEKNYETKDEVNE